jgi:hypothetical protein
MDNERGRRHLIMTVVAVAVLLVVGFLFATLSPSGRAMVGGPTTLLGWAVPLVLLFVVVAATWFVIVRGSHDVPEDTARYVSCWSCGHSIQNEWRMCPYCGADMRSWPAPDSTLEQN